MTWVKDSEVDRPRGPVYHYDKIIRQIDQAGLAVTIRQLKAEAKAKKK